jgi:predicted nucleic acid-binding protein
VKLFFDTSTLVAAILSDHPSHQPCLYWLQKVTSDEATGYVTNHTLAELYAVLTRLPLPKSLNASTARYAIVTNLAKFQIVALTTEDYNAILDIVTAQNILGGGIYDVLIARAALNAKADLLLTLNPKHFVRIGADVQAIVKVPSDTDYKGSITNE